MTPKVLVYHLEGPCVPLVVRVPQVENHWFNIMKGRDLEKGNSAVNKDEEHCKNSLSFEISLVYSMILFSHMKKLPRNVKLKSEKNREVTCGGKERKRERKRERE